MPVANVMMKVDIDEGEKSKNERNNQQKHMKNRKENGFSLIFSYWRSVRTLCIVSCVHIHRMYFFQWKWKRGAKKVSKRQQQQNTHSYTHLGENSETMKPISLISIKITTIIHASTTTTTTTFQFVSSVFLILCFFVILFSRFLRIPLRNLQQYKTVDSISSSKLNMNQQRIILFCINTQIKLWLWWWWCWGSYRKIWI